MSRRNFSYLIFSVLTLAIMLSGCGSIKYGRMPDTEKLSSALIQDVSTKADVLNALGAPRGYGIYQMEAVPDPYAAWFYEYIESDGKKIRLKMLLVFFDREIYAGHMWFASDEELQEVKRQAP